MTVRSYFQIKTFRNFGECFLTIGLCLPLCKRGDLPSLPTDIGAAPIGQSMRKRSSSLPSRRMRDLIATADDLPAGSAPSSERTGPLIKALFQLLNLEIHSTQSLSSSLGPR